MKSDVFITRVARGAVVSALATCLTPQTHTATAVPLVGQESAFNDRVVLPEEGTQRGSEETVVVTLKQPPTEWDPKMEREFRKLAMEEAKGMLTTEQAARLEEMERWRNVLSHPQSSEDILVQIKRDRLLEKMESLLREYVQFQEATGQKRAAA